MEDYIQYYTIRWTDGKFMRLDGSSGGYPYPSVVPRVYTKGKVQELMDPEGAYHSWNTLWEVLEIHFEPVG